MPFDSDIGAFFPGGDSGWACFAAAFGQKAGGNVLTGFVIIQPNVDEADPILRFDLAGDILPAVFADGNIAD